MHAYYIIIGWVNTALIEYQYLSSIPNQLENQIECAICQLKYINIILTAAEDLLLLLLLLHVRNWPSLADMKSTKGRAMSQWGMGRVSILTGINMAFYTISRQRDREREGRSGSGREMDRGKKKPLLA